MSAARAHTKAPTSAQSLREYGRGLAGGLVFSLPLLYTMEVWWAGFIATPGQILGYLGFVFVLLLGYNRYAGIRYDASWTEVFIDSMEELGLGIITAAGALFLIGQIGPGQSMEEILGKTLVEAGLVAIGFSVGTAQLGTGDEGERGAAGEDEDEPPSFASQIVIASCGAFLFAANVAPTEEVVLIAVKTPPGRLLGLALLSAGMAMMILYFSDFMKAHRIVRAESAAQVAAGTIVTYAIALAASAVILWFFGRFNGVSADVCVRQTIVLGFPAVLGASAGRLVLHR